MYVFIELTNSNQNTIRCSFMHINQVFLFNQDILNHNMIMLLLTHFPSIRPLQITMVIYLSFQVLLAITKETESTP